MCCYSAQRIYHLHFRVFRFVFLYSEVVFWGVVCLFVCFFQKQVDINAAVQALIESNAALQMEVMYFSVFTLSYTECI